MKPQLTGKALVAAGHLLAKQIGPNTPPKDTSALISALATYLDVALVRGDQLQKQANQLAAENATSRKAVQTFCDVVGSNTDALCEEFGTEGVGVILAAMEATGNMPATDAVLVSVRAEGIHFVANHMLAAWDSGFIQDTPQQAYDITGAILTAIEFLPNATAEELKRDFADQIRSEIAAQAEEDRQQGGV